ncbi:extracellular solute-binding protein [Mesorhizobium australicum]|uniref:Putrescine-binding periplasmic protein n=1 Tax=Mesorhizobium australicum TaxID=536018 RepID=A0A1X7NJK7_9HYPH|nr:extracellular solute-binding protein [Mesorhizobium australicum]SMH37987.1 spermidine/putrescine transport system substrate-binding protein [Mesorhizobium australicum]
MKRSTMIAALGAALLASTGLARAEGELNIFNWGNYTSPELIKKFSDEYKIKVTVTDYDSNDTALGKIRQGGHGFDIVVPSASYVQIWVEEGLLLESNPNQMENFKNVDPRWVDVEFDPGRKYTVPWQWGSTGVSVDTSVYKGDINTSAIFLDPPAELAGKINVVPEMADVMHLAIRYMGGEPCTGDKEILKKVRDKLVEAKTKWISMNYGNIEAMAKGDYAATVNWNGASLRMRDAKASIHYGYPNEGYPLWMDNAAILKDAKNVENAKLFLNYVMAPENAALISNFAKYANGIKGSEKFMPPEMATAPEIVTPAEFADKGKFMLRCAPDVQEIYTKIWTEVQK